MQILVTLNKTPLSGVVVRVFDRNDPNFRAFTGGDKNPPSSKYPQIYESRQGEVTLCTTDSRGTCTAGFTSKFDTLYIVKFTNPRTSAADYFGLPGSSSDFKGSNVVGTKQLNIRR